MPDGRGACLTWAVTWNQQISGSRWDSVDKPISNGKNARWFLTRLSPHRDPFVRTFCEMNRQSRTQTGSYIYLFIEEYRLFVCVLPSVGAPTLHNRNPRMKMGILRLILGSNEPDPFW